MPLMHYVATALALQIEDFPTEVKEGESARPFERSCEGSLHLRPGSTLDLTADEHAFIKEKHPTVFSSLRCMMTDEARAASVAAQAADEKPKEEAKASDDGPADDAKPAKQKRS